MHIILAGLLLFGAVVPTTAAQSNDAALFAKTFDAHGERLRDDYPYFELYEVDWEAERGGTSPNRCAATAGGTPVVEHERFVRERRDTRLPSS